MMKSKSIKKTNDIMRKISFVFLLIKYFVVLWPHTTGISSWVANNILTRFWSLTRLRSLSAANVYINISIASTWCSDYGTVIRSTILYTSTIRTGISTRASTTAL